MSEELKPCPFCGSTKLKIDKKSVGKNTNQYQSEHLPVGNNAGMSTTEENIEKIDQ